MSFIAVICTKIPNSNDIDDRLLITRQRNNDNIGRDERTLSVLGNESRNSSSSSSTMITVEIDPSVRIPGMDSNDCEEEDEEEMVDDDQPNIMRLDFI